MFDKLGDVWTALENRAAVLLGIVALGRILWVSIQIYEGKREMRVALLLIESMTIAAVYILASATIALLPTVMLLIFDRDFVVGDEIQRAICLLYGWLGIHGMQFMVVRFLQRRGDLPDLPNRKKKS